jgi:putative flavoprotein involved in K+ transport
MSDVLVVGAGPGGLAVAAELGRRGVSTNVLDKADAVGSAWRAHYERLHLHTIRWNSHLPGLKIPRAYGRWVARADVVRYLDAYAAHHRLDVALGVQVTAIERDGSGWLVRSPQGDRRSRFVVVATGYNHTPDLPNWDGLDAFGGEVVHSARYRDAGPYAGRDVLVVGTGNTGAEIAVDLVEGGAARVRLAVRTVPTFVRRQVGPMLDNSGTGRLLRRLPVRLVDRIIATSSRLTTPDLSAQGLPRPEAGAYTRLLADGAVPIIDVGLIDLLQSGRVEVVAAVAGFDGDKVRLADGTEINPDAVIAATGFRRGLDNLVGPLELLDDHGRPTVHGAVTHPHAPDLYFTGFTNPISGMFHELNVDARRIARAIAARLR